ncbi:DUF5615 family PIN-like protein [Halonotius sp. GCM10025705]|uniref:DUF5615 family PIN-like protein n=1 Tax=Halonotius sp. GCM10025705 TaxID=3252678 RepID=UPI00361D5916
MLLDENIAASLATKLGKADHDVERVVDVSELGEGVDDTAICRYAAEEHRIIVTSDDDFVELPLDAHAGVFYVPPVTAGLQMLPHHPARYRSVRSMPSNNYVSQHNQYRRLSEKERLLDSVGNSFEPRFCIIPKRNKISI